jgi:hypothetical protein
VRVYFDTEFVDDGKTIEFISIGMIREDGKTYYAVTNNGVTINKAVKHDWLRKNVVNQLPITLGTGNGWDWNFDHEDHKSVKSRTEIAADIKKFLGEVTNLELWAWYAAYDHVVLAQIFGTMLQLPNGVPMWTNDLRQELHRLGNPRYIEQVEGAHNALEDAKWNRQLGMYLKALDGPLRGPIRDRTGNLTKE